MILFWITMYMKRGLEGCVIIFHLHLSIQNHSLFFMDFLAPKDCPTKASLPAGFPLSLANGGTARS